MAAIRSLGTHPDVPDQRDHQYRVPSRLRRALPPAVDLSPGCPPVYDQGRLNSCSANAIAAAIWFDELKQNGSRALAPSRLFIYYNERAREEITARNAAVSLRDGYKSVARRGVCPEKLWPYREDRFARKPPSQCYRAALGYRVIRYRRLKRELLQFKACLAEGYPFSLGVSVYESFKKSDVRRTGLVQMPSSHEKHIGGHAMLVVGFDEIYRTFLVRNSWGTRWGRRGYCLMPYEYLLNPDLAWDFWTARRVGNETRPTPSHRRRKPK